MSVNVKQVIEVLLELDQQVISPRPSFWGEAAMLVALLARRAVPHLTPEQMGDWRSLDFDRVAKRPSGKLNQPMLDEVTRNDVMG